MSARLTIEATPIPGLHVLQRRQLGDDRGYFERMYCVDELSGLLGVRRIQQVNRTLTAQSGTVRGLHFQRPPHAETKVVSCLRGAVFDVAVDLRRGSPTFLRWHGEVLSAKNLRSLWIPEGFAHGFQTLEDGSEMLYFHTSSHVPAAEAGINVLDATIAIDWPRPVVNLSARDLNLPTVPRDYEGVAT